jgi:hypothetical protein
VLSELLSLTKLNWNSADFAARYPVTVPENIPFRQEYRFYM